MIIVDWGSADENLLIWKFHGHWTDTEYSQAVMQSNALIVSQPHIVDIICDMREAKIPKTSVLSLAVAAIQRRPRNLGVTIIITHSTFWQNMYELLKRNRRLKRRATLHFVNDVDRAYNIVYRIQLKRRYAR